MGDDRTKHWISHDRLTKSNRINRVVKMWLDRIKTGRLWNWNPPLDIKIVSILHFAFDVLLTGVDLNRSRTCDNLATFRTADATSHRVHQCLPTWAAERVGAFKRNRLLQDVQAHRAHQIFQSRTWTLKTTISTLFMLRGSLKSSTSTLGYRYRARPG